MTEDVSTSSSGLGPRASTPPMPRGIPTGRIVLLLIGIALMGWIVVRVRVATAEQARLLTERGEAAEAAKKERKDKPVQLVAGTPATWRPVVRIEGTLAAAE